MNIDSFGTIFEDMDKIYLSERNYDHAVENIQIHFPKIKIMIDPWCSDDVMYGFHVGGAVTTLIIKREDSNNSRNPL